MNETLIVSLSHYCFTVSVTTDDITISCEDFSPPANKYSPIARSTSPQFPHAAKFRSRAFRLLCHGPRRSYVRAFPMLGLSRRAPSQAVRGTSGSPRIAR